MEIVETVEIAENVVDLTTMRKQDGKNEKKSQNRRNYQGNCPNDLQFCSLHHNRLSYSLDANEHLINLPHKTDIFIDSCILLLNPAY